MSDSVGKIFDRRPKVWGFRGDPYLWDDLEKHFSTISLPYSEEEFLKEIHRVFEELTGDKIESSDSGIIFISRYSHGGMSSGMVSQEFWMNKALPMLLKRLLIANTDSISDM